MKVVALLRGINVGGHKKIKMADLRALFAGLGFRDVETYIQSGNVAFEAAGMQEHALVKKLERAIERSFGFQVPIVVRTHDELSGILLESPFPSFDVSQEGTLHSVCFLSEPPQAEKVEALSSLVVPPEELIVHGREAYLHCPQGTGKSKLTPDFLEKKLGVTGTTRNWKTLLRLIEMSAT